MKISSWFARSYSWLFSKPVPAPVPPPVVTPPAPPPVVIPPVVVPTPAPPPPPTIPPSLFVASQRGGTNLAGLESVTYDQYSVANGPPPGNYPPFNQALIDWLAASGVKEVRLLFSWEAVQSSLGGPVPASGANYQAYWTTYTKNVKALLAAGIAVLCEPWGYNAKIGDTDICYRGAAFTASNFAAFWGSFAKAINAATSNDQRVAFGLMNEPHVAGGGSIGITLAGWYTYAQAAISTIRATGATNTIGVPGMGYADAASFVSNGSAAQHLKLVDPANALMVSVHDYDGIGASSKTALSGSLSALATWARANGVKVHIGEIAIDAGSPTGSLATAKAQWADFAAFMKANADVFVGWCWWATGMEAGWWDNGDSANGNHWGLAKSGTLTTPSLYMTLIAGTF